MEVKLILYFVSFKVATVEAEIIMGDLNLETDRVAQDLVTDQVVVDLGLTLVAVVVDLETVTAEAVVTRRDSVIQVGEAVVDSGQGEEEIWELEVLGQVTLEDVVDSQIIRVDR